MFAKLKALNVKVRLWWFRRSLRAAGIDRALLLSETRQQRRNRHQKLVRRFGQ